MLHKVVILLSLLLLPFIGTYYFLKKETKKVKREIKHKIIAGTSKEELVHLTFHKNELETSLKWKHSKEFEYKGQMFDIVETKKTTDSVSYWCWWDNKETELNQRLSSLLSFVVDAKRQTKDVKDRVEQVLKSFYLDIQILSNQTISKLITHSISLKNVLLKVYLDVLFPPPIG